MTDRAQRFTDNAETHKFDILKTADNYYSGEIDSEKAAQKLTKSLFDAYNDGSAKDLFQKLGTTPFGQANAKVVSETGPLGRDLQTIEITPGFWQTKESERQHVGFRASILHTPDNLDPAQISIQLKSR